MFDSLWQNIHLATMTGDGLGIITNGAIGITEGRIAYAGPAAAAPAGSDYVYDGEGRWALPGLVDCHTHLVYAGNRAEEFERRLTGESYADIAKGGGGIRATMRAVRAASEDEIVAAAIKRAGEMFNEGVTTIEIKSGYGLDLAGERKLLQAAARLSEETGLRIQKTFLGAHAVPPEFDGRADDYIDCICRQMLPALHQDGLIDAVDAFCETIAFSSGQVAKVFEAARSLGLPVKLHAEQLTNSRGAALAARYEALSADHLEYLDDAGAAAMAAAGTVAVLLPAAFYHLRETKLPPVDLLRKHRVPVALATDHNPGTAPTLSLLLMANMGCTLFGLTVEEALRGITRLGARALGLSDLCGTLETGKAADIALYEIDHPRDLAARFGANPCTGAILSGTYFSFGE